MILISIRDENMMLRNDIGNKAVNLLRQVDASLPTPDG